jgi:hypothetical protein
MSAASDPAAPTSTCERHDSAHTVEHLRTTLCHLIDLSGLSRRQVEQRLLENDCGTDLGRLLSGRLALKLAHILDICHVIGIYPQELFRIVFPPTNQRSPLLQRLDAVTQALHTPAPARAPAASPPLPDLQEVSQRLVEILQRLDTLTATRDPSTPREALTLRGLRTSPSPPSRHAP